MNTKTLTFNKLNISFFDNKKDADTTILFIHGNSLSASLFQHQLNDPALNQYRIVAADLPGHGASAKSDNPDQDYGVLSFIDMLRSLVMELNLNNIVLVGHSLGGHIAIHLLPLLQESGVNVKGIVIMGTPPLTIPPKMEQAFLPNPAIGLAFKPDLASDELQLLTSAFISLNNPYFNQVKDTIKDTDPLVRPSIGRSISTEIKQSEVDLLLNSGVPLAVLHGENDSLINREYIQEQGLNLWGNQVHTIEQAGHIPFLEQPEQFRTILQDFLNSI
ncbi:MAG: alpha/beta hydrolase [Perlabentimonas sp.]